MRTEKYLDKLVITANQRVKERKYWLKQLSGDLEKIGFPYDKRMPFTAGQEDSIAGIESLSRRLNPDLYHGLLEISNSSDYALHVFLIAGLVALLYKYTGQRDILIGTPIYQQEGSGEFINTILPLRVRFEESDTFKELLMQTRQILVEAIEHQSFPIAILGKWLSLGGQGNFSGMLETVVVLRNIHRKEYVRDLSPGIVFDFLRTEECIELNLEYNERNYTSVTAAGIAGHYLHVLEGVLRDREVRLINLDILGEEEKNRLLCEFNRTEAAYPGERTIHSLIEDQVVRTPDAAAVTVSVSFPSVLTYKGLNEISTRQALFLIEKGIKPDSVAAILLERSLEMMIGILGILKAGGAYLPIDPEYPEERKQYILTDSGINILLSDRDDPIKGKSPVYVYNLVSSIPMVERQQNRRKGKATGQSLLPLNLNANSLAYVIYTSGSTGKPKGTMIQHYSLVNRLNWMQKEFRLENSDTILQKTPFTFDVSVWELFWWGITGAKLCFLPPRGERDPGIIVNSIERNNITVMHFVPSMLNVFLEYVEIREAVNRLKSLRQVIASGEALSLTQVELFNRLLLKQKNTRLANLYGPTEVTIDVSWFDCSGGEKLEIIPIGKPIDNIRFYIVDKYMRLQPQGIAGELCIAGDGLARGYLNRPELSGEKFVLFNYRSFRANMSYTSNQSNRLYRTGDLARWQPDGNVEFLGRIDHQVKIRGFRIELGEIENRLLKHPKIKEAVVISRDNENDDKYLCAYLVAGGEIPPEELREYLLKSLPEYMVPVYFIFLEYIPLTGNGKVNRKALPEPENQTGTDYIAPRDEVEDTLARIWSEELGIEKEKIGINTSFFSLGGHSLRATRVIAKIHKEFNTDITMAEMFSAPYIKKMAERIKRTATGTYIPIQPVEKKEYYPLSPGQKRLYVLQQMEVSGTGYNILNIFALQDRIDWPRLENTFKHLVTRHESLRTSFSVIGGEPVQLIHEQVDFKVGEYPADISGGTEQELKKSIEHTIKRFIRPFDLSKPPLMRAGIVISPGGQTLLMIDMHHIVTDGVSQDILNREFLEVYGGEELPPPLAIQYKDYSRWLSDLQDTDSFLRQEKYWLSEFSGTIPLLNLPIDYPRPAVLTFEGKITGFRLGEEETRALRKLAENGHVTLFMTLLAVYTVFLSKLCQQDDLVVGVPIAGRRHADLAKVIGMFVNTLAVRSNPLENQPFDHFLSETGEKTLAAFSNQDYQFEDLVEKVVKERDTGRNPLFDAVFLFQNVGQADPQKSKREDSLNAKPYGYVHNTAKFDLKLEGTEVGNELFFTFEYRTTLFKEATIQRFIEYWRKTISVVTQEPGILIRDIEIIPPLEKEWLLYRLNDRQWEYPRHRLLHRLFADQAADTPDLIAVIGKSREETPPLALTYRELNEKAEAMAFVLRKKGVTAGSIVGLMAQRSPAAVTAIIAILKAGAAFLPVDAEYPEERKQFMIKDSRLEILLTQQLLLAENSTLMELVSRENTLLVDDFYPGAKTGEGIHTPPRDKPGENAYLIYTSGSTGRPKGVAVGHDNAVNYITWAIRQYVQGEKVNFPLFTSLSFDLTITSIFTPLLSGNQVVVYEGTAKESLIEKVIEDNLVDVVKLTPSHLRLILSTGIGGSEGIHSRVKRFIVGGEALDTALAGDVVNRFKNPVEIFNEYGPTEATVGCMIYRYCPEKDKGQSVPVGLAADNVHVYLLDKNLQPVPLGTTGEMYISGAGVARGYLNRVELTAEKFLKNPFLGRRRMYRTGDMARHLEDGNIEFLGRIDHQVKIRGFRIELGEIENHIKTYRKHNSIDAPSVNEYRLCRACLLPANYPGIQFDQQGICNTCREYEKNRDNVDKYFKPKEDFMQLVNQLKETNRGNYDCLLLFSGGKDSTYVLYQLIDMGLKVLTFTFDNGYISDAAFANIKNTCTNLGVENITLQAENMNRVFVESLNSHQDVCHGCWNALNTLAIQLAHERGINLLISGLSRGQILEMRLEGLFERGIFTEEEIEENLLLFRKSFHSKNNKFLRILGVDIPEDVVGQMHFVDFFRYFDTPITGIKEYLDAKGWVQPADTGFCSSNCLVNDVGIFMFLKQRGYHFYAQQLSWDSRLGVITREQGLQDTDFAYDLSRVEKILKEIGYFDTIIQDVVVSDEEDDNKERRLTAYIVSEEEFTVGDIRSYLAGRLPEYMIPSHYVRVERIPLTPAGKVDRRALSRLKDARLRVGTTYIAPGTQIERLIADAWKTVLRLDDVGVEDNFFDLGGTSYDVIKINSRLELELKKSLPVVNLFKYPTIRSLADYLTQGEVRTELSPEKEREIAQKVDLGKNRLRERARRSRSMDTAS